MSARTFENARKIARLAPTENERVTIMSNLLWDVLAQDGGFVGLSDAGFDAFCETHKQYVSRDIALKAQWARTVKWPRTAEEDAEVARWREAYARTPPGRAAAAQKSKEKEAA